MTKVTAKPADMELAKPLSLASLVDILKAEGVELDKLFVVGFSLDDGVSGRFGVVAKEEATNASFLIRLAGPLVPATSLFRVIDQLRETLLNRFQTLRGGS